MAHPRPNLARRPFVDARPANVAVGLLLLAAVLLSVTSVRTVYAYLDGSRRSREEIASLRDEIARLEASRKDAEQKLARFDLEGMKAGAEEANALARLRAFSWSRFLTRLEKTLPNDYRVVAINLARPSGREAGESLADEGFLLSLSLVTPDRDGMPRLLKALYASPWFEEPTPVSESSGEKGMADGAVLSVTAVYRDREARK